MARVKGILEDLHGRLDDNFTICHRGDTTFTRPAHIRQPHRLSRKQLLIRERQSHNNALWRALKESGHVYFEANKPAYNHFMAINMQSPVPYIPKQQFHSGNALLLPGMVLSDGPLTPISYQLDEVDGQPALLTDLTKEEAQKFTLHLLRALHHRRSPPSRRQVLRRTDRRGQVNDKKCDFCGYSRKNDYLYRGITKKLGNMKKILFIIGSLRAKSFNRQVANVAKEIIGSRAEVQELDYSDLPLLNQDIEQPEPVVVARIRKAVAEADGLWIFTPEYNMSYPGHLKNLLDWLSRPVKFMDYGTPTCINGKRVAISGAGGKAATADCRKKLTELLTFMKAEVLPEQVGIAVPAEAWGTDVLVLTDEQRAELKALADKLIDG